MSEEHSNGTHLLFCFGLALLACHELDAVARHEWRLFPGLSLLDDQTALTTFIFLHVPLFTGLFWLTGHNSAVIRRPSQLAVDAFLIVHAGVHVAFSNHALYEFQFPLEESLIFGGAVIGALHAVLMLRGKLRG